MALVDLVTLLVALEVLVTPLEVQWLVLVGLALILMEALVVLDLILLVARWVVLEVLVILLVDL